MPEDFAANVWDFARRLEGVEQRASGSSSVPALFVGRIEFLHFHGGTMDLRLPPPLVAVEIAKGGVRRHHLDFAARDGWVEVDVRSGRDVERAKELVAKAHAGAANLAGT